MSLQEANYKGHRASKVLFLGNLKKLLSTGTSRWNNRQMALWDQVSHHTTPQHPFAECWLQLFTHHSLTDQTE